MNAIKVVIVSALFAAVACNLIRGFAQSNDTWKLEALPAIQEYDDRYADILNGREDVVFDSPHPRDTFHHDVSIYYSANGSCRGRLTIDRGKRKESVLCCNSIYRFKLSRRLGDGNPWKLEEMDYVPRENSDWFRDPELFKQKDQYVLELKYQSPFTVFHCELTEILKSPSFDTITVDKSESGSVIVNCKYFNLGEDIDAEFEFLPDDWLLKSARLKMFHRKTGTKKELVRTWDYGNTLVPKSGDQTITLLNEARIDDETVLPAGMVLSTFHADFYEDDVKQRRPSDFRLSFFGLPEPEGVRWGWPPAVWISIVGLLLLGIVAWKRARRSRTA